MSLFLIHQISRFLVSRGWQICSFLTGCKHLCYYGNVVFGSWWFTCSVFCYIFILLIYITLLCWKFSYTVKFLLTLSLSTWGYSTKLKNGTKYEKSWTSYDLVCQISYGQNWRHTSVFHFPIRLLSYYMGGRPSKLSPRISHARLEKLFLFCVSPLT